MRGDQPPLILADPMLVSVQLALLHLFPSWRISGLAATSGASNCD